MAKILLVDDDRLMTKMYEGKFEDDGFDIETASDGKVGLAKAKSFKPDLILLDIMMPKMDGLTALNKMKKDTGLKNIPIILLTNVGDDEDYVKQGLQAGAIAYLVKSAHDPKEVVSKVKDVLVGHGVKSITSGELMKAKIRGEKKSAGDAEREEAEEEYLEAKRAAEDAAKKLKSLKKK